ncbi:MAG: ribulokinase [Chthoniobacterales bacterium]
MQKVALGLDFGTVSVRVLLVDLTGVERGESVTPYRHGAITQTLPGTGERLPPDFALQDPRDWLEAGAEGVRMAMRAAGVEANDVVGIGVDFTSCTMLPALGDGTPLCATEKFSGNKYAWPKLWKHHGARRQTDRINALARERCEPWLDRYGGTIGLEWFFPKMLETLEEAPDVYASTDVWLEAGDWLVWQLTRGPARELARSTCQAGYKAMWGREGGFPTPEFFAALDSRMADVVEAKMPGRFVAPGHAAGGLCAAMAGRFGLAEGTPISAAIIDAHAGVPGCGAAEPGTLVMVMGTSSCHMLNADSYRTVPGVAGIVEDGILPGMVGYETGQAAVGDSFDWIRGVLGRPDFADLDRAAAALPPGCDGVVALDWLNGCRTPLMDGALKGAFSGLTLAHGPAHLYRALLEGSAFGLRWIVDLLREHGVPVERFVATGGLPHHNPQLVQIYADVLGAPVEVHPSKYGPALGAAILGACAAGPAAGFRDVTEAIRAMAMPEAVRREIRRIEPGADAARDYPKFYERYRVLGTAISELGK